jgi:Spy/CpxP family protein refolding chaperone
LQLQLKLEDIMKLLSTLTLSGLLLLGLPAFAQQQVPADPQQFVAEAKAPAACAAINPITDDQKQRLSAIRDKYELDTADKKALLHVTQRQLRRTLTATTVDKSSATALQAKVNGLRDDLANSKLNLKLAMGDVFTPEQRAAFRQMRGRFGHHGRRFAHHHGFSGPNGPRLTDGGKPPVG